MGAADLSICMQSKKKNLLGRSLLNHYYLIITDKDETGRRPFCITMAREVVDSSFHLSFFSGFCSSNTSLICQKRYESSSHQFL